MLYHFSMKKQKRSKITGNLYYPVNFYTKAGGGFQNCLTIQTEKSHTLSTQSFPSKIPPIPTSLLLLTFPPSLQLSSSFFPDNPCNFNLPTIPLHFQPLSTP